MTREQRKIFRRMDRHISKNPGVKFPKEVFKLPIIEQMILCIRMDFAAL